MAVTVIIAMTVSAAMPRVTVTIVLAAAMEVMLWAIMSTLTTRRQMAMVAVARIVVVIYVTMKARMTMEPRTGTDEDTVAEPRWAIVAVRRAVVRSVREVSVGTDGLRSNIYGERNLCGLRVGCGHEENCGGHGQKHTFELMHD